MEQTLHSVAGSELMSFLDGFSGYNQILVHPDDRLKTTFRTKWGTYAYQKMPFVLINAGATFQRVMDIAFKGFINKLVVVYFDDIIVFSKKRSNPGFKTSMVYFFWLCYRRIHSKNHFLPTFQIPIRIHHQDNLNAW